MSIIAAFTRTGHQWVPEYRYGNIGGVSYKEKRMVETKVYEAIISDDHVLANVPVNPENLSSPWEWESTDDNAPLGVPLQRGVREVWVNKSGQWGPA